MELTMDQVQAAALTLSEVDRVQLADTLYDSIGKGPSVEKAIASSHLALAESLDRRWSDLNSRSVAGLSEEEVHAELDALVDG